MSETMDPIGLAERVSDGVGSARLLDAGDVIAGSLGVGGWFLLLVLVGWRAVVWFGSGRIRIRIGSCRRCMMRVVRII